MPALSSCLLSSQNHQSQTQQLITCKFSLSLDTPYTTTGPQCTSPLRASVSNRSHFSTLRFSSNHNPSSYTSPRLFLSEFLFRRRQFSSPAPLSRRRQFKNGHLSKFPIKIKYNALFKNQGSSNTDLRLSLPDWQPQFAVGETKLAMFHQGWINLASI